MEAQASTEGTQITKPPAKSGGHVPSERDREKVKANLSQEPRKRNRICNTDEPQQPGNNGWKSSTFLNPPQNQGPRKTWSRAATDRPSYKDNEGLGTTTTDRTQVLRKWKLKHRRKERRTLISRIAPGLTDHLRDHGGDRGPRAGGDRPTHTVDLGSGHVKFQLSTTSSK